MAKQCDGWQHSKVVGGAKLWPEIHIIREEATSNGTEGLPTQGSYVAERSPVATMKLYM